jgi:hypothetical protein
MLIVFGLLALYRGWTLHGETAVLAYALGALSLGIGAWRIVSGVKERRQG